MSGPRAFADVAVGAQLPELRRVVTREDFTAYAAAGGDQNPLHQDDDFARQVGFGSVIAHGMFTMGHMAACLVTWAGDAATVVELSAGFREPVYPGEELVAGGSVRALDPDARTATLELWVAVLRDGETVWPVKRGAAVVRLV